jgi:Rrf2 family protein
MTMDISRRTYYAIRLIAALVEANKPLSVREAAEMQEVPYAFARSIQHDMVRSGLIRSIRGAHGGMVLARESSELTLLDLIEAVQGPVSVSVCANEKGWCSRDTHCQFHKVWEGANGMLMEYVSSINVKKLLDEGFLSATSRVPHCQNC